MNTDTADKLTGLGYTLLFVPLLIWNAYVWSVLWEWFIAVPFEIRSMTMPHAIGLFALIMLIRGGQKYTKQPKKTEDDTYIIWITWALSGIFIPLFALVIGSVVRGMI